VVITKWHIFLNAVQSISYKEKSLSFSHLSFHISPKILGTLFAPPIFILELLHLKNTFSFFTILFFNKGYIMKFINHNSTLLMVLGLILILNLSCEKPTDPPLINEPDTTSQNFTFDTFEFGNGYHTSYLHDVWIFNENNAWAVGYIQSDTVINANILRWNGSKWYVDNFEGQSSGIRGIWAKDTSHIFFAAGAILEYKEGNYIWHDQYGFSTGQSIDHIWGSSEKNIWGVGKRGAIVHYDGSEWKKVNFDTQWTFTRITGSTESGIAYAIAHSHQFDFMILELKQSSQTIIYSREQGSNAPRPLGIISLTNDYLSCSDNNIWQFNLRTSEYEILKEYPFGHSYFSISGTESNDLYYFGGGAGTEKMIHFNGKRYTEFIMIENDFLTFRGSDAIKNLAVLVGFHNQKAYINMIKRR
jgi:hypothetical protein